MKETKIDGAIRPLLIIHIESKAFISSDFGFIKNSEINVADTPNDLITYAPKPCLRRVAIITGHFFLKKESPFPLHTISNRGSLTRNISGGFIKKQKTNHYVKAAI